MTEADEFELALLMREKFKRDHQKFIETLTDAILAGRVPLTLQRDEYVHYARA